MAEIRCSVNGKYFKDFGTYVSKYDGFFDGLKRKKINSYDWAEYHGESLDLSNPKFEAREISLKCFVVGDNWLQMKTNFDTIFSEFQKPGTQRLLIEPFNEKPLPYEVFIYEDVNLNKDFKDGKMVGIFTLKLIEPNPIKKVLYFTGNTLNLSYNSPNETEIFYGNGLKDIVKGNASISGKVLANRVVSGYDFGGRNLAKNSKALIDSNSYYIRNFLLSENLVSGEKYVITLETKVPNQNANAFFLVGDLLGNQVAIIVKISPTKFQVAFTYLGASINELVLFRYPNDNSYYQFSTFKIEKGNKATDWTPAPEDEKYIIIAGNIEEITDLTTNADKILWERL